MLNYLLVTYNGISLCLLEELIYHDIERNL